MALLSWSLLGGGDMQAILTWMAAGLARLLADKVLAWLALKAVLVCLFTLVVPIILNNVLYEVIETMMNFASAQAGNSLNGSMSFTGFMGWLISLFRLPECLSVLVSALVLRVSLSMVPFVRMV